MRQVFILPSVVSFIKNHALQDENEIYGWLIGYEDLEKIVNIIAAFDCLKYASQSQIAAVPDPQEIQAVVSSMPQGIGTVGIYHSHPSKVFHSHVDDTTIRNLARMYPKLVSIVTNGTEIEYFRFEEKEVVLFKPEFSSGAFKRPHLEFYLDIKTKITLNLEKPPAPQISAALLKILNQIWSTRVFQQKKSRLYPKESITSYLNSRVQILLSLPSPDPDSTFPLDITLKAVVFVNGTETFEAIDDLIKSELMDDLNQSVFQGHFDPKSQKMQLAPRVEITYMNIPLKFYVNQDPQTPKFSPFFHDFYQRIRNLIQLNENDLANALIIDLEQILKKVKDPELKRQVQTLRIFLESKNL